MSASVPKPFAPLINTPKSVTLHPNRRRPGLGAYLRRRDFISIAARHPHSAAVARARRRGDRVDETQMINWALDKISDELMWALVVIVVIAAVAVVALLKK